ncbi:histidine phosphatase superfamily [Cladochytrium replicatum]|nr:histidine phosphatase superfamily [Cladochytrium replicatum]
MLFPVVLLAASAAAQASWQLREHLGSKSPYSPPAENETVVSPLPETCRVIHLQVVGRHGTRFPGMKDTLGCQGLEKVPFNIKLSHNLKESLMSWSCPFPIKKIGLLARAGEYEVYELGRRLGRRYPNRVYSPTFVKIRSSAVSRSGQSASAFSAGFFEGSGGLEMCGIPPIYQTTLPKMMDYELVPKHACPRWSKTLYEDPRRQAEMSAYRTLRIQSIADRLTESLMTPPAKLTTENIEAMYRTCAFELSSSTHLDEAPLSPWCKVFDQEDIEALEYLDDLSHYYLLSYGHEFNEIVGCALSTAIANELLRVSTTTRQASSMKMRFQFAPVEFDQNIFQTPEESDPLDAVFYFGHSETNTFLLSLLGLYRDPVPLRANLTQEQISQRRFRSSRVSFAMNIVFELVSCETEEDHYVRALVNEREVLIPGCHGPGALCHLHHFVERVIGPERYLCNYERICGIPKDRRRPPMDDDNDDDLVRKIFRGF